jgi:hypothetical protein
LFGIRMNIEAELPLKVIAAIIAKHRVTVYNGDMFVIVESGL